MDLIIEPILFLWNILCTFYYTRVCHSVISPFLGGQLQSWHLRNLWSVYNSNIIEWVSNQLSQYNRIEYWINWINISLLWVPIGLSSVYISLYLTRCKEFSWHRDLYTLKIDSFTQRRTYTQKETFCHRDWNTLKIDFFTQKLIYAQ